jgi:hypothetical protein
MGKNEKTPAFTAFWPDGGMADAQDLKSCGRLLPCGFESRSGYSGIAKNTVFTVFSCGFMHRFLHCLVEVGIGDLK